MTETQLAAMTDEEIIELAKQSNRLLVREIAKRFEEAFSQGYELGHQDGLNAD